MMVALKTGTIGDHFFCFRAIDDVPCLVEQGFKFASKLRQILQRQLATKRPCGQSRRIAQLVPQT